MFRRQTAAFFAALMLAAAPTLAPAVASARPASTLTADQQALVDRAGAYIQDLKIVRASFTQIDGNGAVTTGTMYLQRPGKARFEYDPPAGLLVVSDGYNVAVHDRRLKAAPQIYPFDRTPLVLLLARHVRLDRGVIISDVQQTPGGFVVNARDGHKKAEGRISMSFGDSPMTLRGWTIVDAQGKETRVQLGPLTMLDHIDTNLFNIQSR